MNAVLLWLFALSVGAAIGSFLNVVIHRGPSSWGLVAAEGPPRGTIVAPRSYCPNCRAPIPSWRLIPVVSYLAQRGRCAACGARIKPRYLLVEIGGAAIAGVALAQYGATPLAILFSVYGWVLLALAAIDLETGYLPDALTLPLLGLGLVANGFGAATDLASALIGAVIGYGAFWAVNEAFRRMRGVDGLGLGDAKLLAAIGAWFGWQALPLVVLIASLASLAVLGALRLGGARFEAGTAVPFGPGLCAAGAALAALPGLHRILI